MKSFRKLLGWFKNKSILEKWAYSITFLGLLIFIWFITRLVFEHYIDPNNFLSLENAARIGDFVGGMVGVFFTLVGVFLLFENLSLQRKELLENRHLIHQQQFENTLFNLLESHRQITNDIRLPNNVNNLHNGKDFFHQVVNEITWIYNYISQKMYLGENQGYEDILLRYLQGEADSCGMSYYPLKNEFIRNRFTLWSKAGRFDTERQILKEAYFILFRYYHSIYGHYFRNLYHILKFIYKNEKEEISIYDNEHGLVENKYKGYADIVQAQLSSSELFVLFFNGFCFKEMKKLIHHYNFLENLAIEDLLKPEHVNEYYEEEIDGKLYPSVRFKSILDIVQ